jgi:putative flavoprotein involved in K+ transport
MRVDRLSSVFWFLANRILSVDTPVGRRVRPKVVSHGGPLIRLTRKDVAAAGVELVSRVATTREGRPVREDGRTVDVPNVILSTGFGHDFSWIDLPGLGSDRLPEHDRGLVASQPGLYFIGLPFLTKLASTFVGGVGNDAKFIVRTIADRPQTEATSRSSNMDLVAASY